MYEINGTSIKLTRGDTFSCAVEIIKDGEVYTPEAGDKVRFALKHKRMTSNNTEFADKKPLILKNIPISNMVLYLEPDDTKGLGFGEYMYDIEITFANGFVATFIHEASFEIRPEVH